MRAILLMSAGGNGPDVSYEVHARLHVDGTVLYVALSESASDSQQTGDQVYTSTDDGVTWQAGSTVRGLLVDDRRF
jgi:hypothetical protein